MNNKKAKQMIETITGAKFTHLWKDGKRESKYCLRDCGRPIKFIKRGVV